MCGLDCCAIKAAHNQKNREVRHARNHPSEQRPLAGTPIRVPFRFVATGWMGTRPRHRVTRMPGHFSVGWCLAEWCRSRRRT